MSKKPRILITGVGGGSVGYQILDALLLLGERHQVVVADADSFSFGLYLVPEREIVPFASAPEYGDVILDVVRRRRIDALLPGTEAEIRVLAPMREKLAEIGCLLVASSVESIALCNDKARLYEWLTENGFGVPRSARVEGWKVLVAAVGFPIVGKPANASSGSRDVAILADETEVKRYIALFQGSATQIVFQEYAGDATSEYTVGVVVSHTGRVIDSFVLHRVLSGMSLGASRVIDGRRYTLSTGYSQGYVEDHAKIRVFCEDLAVRLGLRGPVNIQLRTHGDAIKVFEVHPRFSGTTSIRAEAGFNEPDMVIRDQLLGEEVGRQDYRVNVAAIRALRALIVPIEEMAQKGKRLD